MELEALLKARHEIERQIAEARKIEREEAIATIRNLMMGAGITVADLNQKASKPTDGTRRKVAAKYRNPATGETWSGRGLRPKWLAFELAQGRTLDDFALAHEG